MNVDSYWRNLQRDHEHSMAEASGPGPVDQKLNLILAGVCILTALVLLAVGGYRVGFDAVRDIGRHLPTVFLEILSKFGETSAAICLIALIARRHPRAVWMGVVASVYATALTHALKGVCDTARPAAVLGKWVTVIGPVLKLHSFPSGHTMTAFLLAACISVGAPINTRLLLYALAAAVGLSRVWIGAHWPIDVIAGAGIAGLSVALSISTMRLTDWVPGLIAHLAVVSLIAVCAVWELMIVPEYPLARLLSVVIAACSLSVLARDYVFRITWCGVRTADRVPCETPERPRYAWARRPEPDE